MIDVLVLVYVGISLLMGGLAATIVIWDHPRLHDRTRNKSRIVIPKFNAWEAISFSLYMAVLWPLLFALTACDWIVSRRKKR